jgi:uncharacterized protein (DUF433 family)
MIPQGATVGFKKNHFLTLQRKFGMHPSFLSHFMTLQLFVYCNMNWLDYIVSDNQILLGKPSIKGTRVSVELVLELFAAGWTEQQILESYPTVTAEGLRAVFIYLKACIQQELYFPLSAS